MDDTMQGGSAGAADQVSEAELREARENGWADRDEWRGSPEDWVDARTFNEKSRSILPIVNAKNKQLKDQLSQKDRELAQVAAELRAQGAALKAIQETQAEVTSETLEQDLAGLRSELTAASRDGDHERVAELTEKIVDKKAEIATAKAPPARNAQPARDMVPPEVRQWFDENPDYVTDKRRSRLAAIVSAEMREKGDMRVGKDYLEDVAKEVESILGGQRGGGTSKVSPGNGGTARGAPAGGVKTYADLPAEAKTACDRMANRLVGPDKRFKDVAAWRKSYVQQYFTE